MCYTNVCQLFSMRVAGQCTPCTRGTGWMLKTLSGYAMGRVERKISIYWWMFPTELGSCLRTTICGLGTVPVARERQQSAKFRGDFEASIKAGFEEHYAKSLAVSGHYAIGGVSNERHRFFWLCLE